MWIAKRYEKDRKMFSPVSSINNNTTLNITVDNHFNNNCFIQAYAQEFNVLSSVRELLTYVVKFSCALTTTLSSDQSAQRHRLSERLENVIASMSGNAPFVDTEHIYATVT